jgi:tRNA A-37 threonylcarbamoyl transferase component Bud32
MAYFEMEPTCAEHLRRQGLATFDRLFAYAGGQIIGGHLDRNVTRVNINGLHGFLKREQQTHWKDRWAAWWSSFGFVSRSRREWRVLQALRQRGIACPEPLAVGEDGDRALLLTRELAGMLDLPSYLEEGDCNTRAMRYRLARRLGQTLARFHAAGFSHPDLYAKHVFIHTETGSIQFVDYQRTRWRRRVSYWQRWRDLAALAASLSERMASRRERLACLLAYLRATACGDVRPLLRKALAAIRRRAGHLVQRNRVQAMHRRFERPANRVEYYRIAMPQDRMAAGVVQAVEYPSETQGRW